MWLHGVNQPKDHLHIRGEYSISTCGKVLGKGSSPHTWRILRAL